MNLESDELTPSPGGGEYSLSAPIIGALIQMVSPLRQKWTLHFPGPGLSCFPRRICHRHGDTATPSLACQSAVTWPCGDCHYCDSRPPGAYVHVLASTAGSATTAALTTRVLVCLFALVNYTFFFNLDF